MCTDKLYEAAAARGVNRKQAEAAAQALYENGYISYPYSDGTLMPMFMRDNYTKVWKAINDIAPGLGISTVLDATPFFVEDFQGAHTAIVPLEHNNLQNKSLDDVHPDARVCYELIAKAYLTAVFADSYVDKSSNSPHVSMSAWLEHDHG